MTLTYFTKNISTAALGFLLAYGFHMHGAVSGDLKTLSARDNLIHVHILGADDRQPEEDFGKAENLEAQKILGLREIKKSISSVVPIDCYYTDKEGQAHKTMSNGVLICNKRTLMMNAHSLVDTMCNDVKHNFVCRIHKTRGHYENFINEPKLSNIKAHDICNTKNIIGSDDIALMTLFDESERTSLKIGVVHDFSAIKGMRFVDVSANISDNYHKKTEKTFMVAEFKDMELGEKSIAKTDVDSGTGSSGSAQLIKQDGRLLIVGLHVAGYGRLDRDGLIDGREFLPWRNYTKSIIFNDEIRDFIKKNVRHAEKCFEEVHGGEQSSG